MVTARDALSNLLCRAWIGPEDPRDTTARRYLRVFVRLVDEHWRAVTAQQDRAALLKWAYICI
jgi:hypothetical protein